MRKKEFWIILGFVAVIVLAVWLGDKGNIPIIK